jgi:hypothetical protein
LERNEALLSVGMLCLVVAILLKRFGESIPAAAFVEGVLLGVSVVLNVTYLVRRSKGGTGGKENRGQSADGGNPK